MKLFILFTLILSCGYLLTFSSKSVFSKQEWMARDFTTAIKGFSIITVFWSHTGAKLGVSGIQFIAGIGVSLFLICSGFGLEKSYQHKGLRGFWKNKVLKVCIPFWIVELIGLFLIGYWTFKRYVFDIMFIKTGTSYGWYLRYIVICYLLFYAIKELSVRFNTLKKREIELLLTMFALWFIIESLWFANPSMPFLEARQMLSFPCGILVAKYQNKIIEKFVCSKIAVKISVGVLLIGFFFMAITQLAAVKSMPFVISNFLSLFTVLMLAISILIVGIVTPRLFNNKLLIWSGLISYEIYLVHSFTLNLIENSFMKLSIFVGITIVLAVALHVFITRGVRND